MTFTPATLESLRTARTTIRPLTADDVDAIHAYSSDPEICRYLLFEPRTREEVAEKIEEWAKGGGRLAEKGDYIEYGIDADGLGVIGHIYFTIVSVDDAGGEIGWTLRSDVQGKGYATEAASAMLDYAFDVLKLHRVRAELDPRNTASVALCRRLGMREEAYYVEDLWFKGEWGDTGVYAILDREWAARSR
ncbi:MAG TPA: GNAT family N-acetyltransferase [Pseudolysinimonas sp.]